MLLAAAGSAISPREAFFYLVLFAALATFAYSLGTLLFGIIEKTFPDPTGEWASRVLLSAHSTA